jgi:hypothetical protein
MASVKASIFRFLHCQPFQFMLDSACGSLIRELAREE